MRSLVLAGAAALLVVLASPVRAPAAVQTAVQCPSSVGGGYDYVAAKTHWMLDDPTFLSIFCDYVNPSQSPDQSLVELQVFWSVQAPAHGCTTRPGNNQTVLSDSKFALVSWGTGNAADPPDLQNSVQRLLRAAEAEAAPCSGGPTTGASAAVPPPVSVGAPAASTTSHSGGGSDLELVEFVAAGTTIGALATTLLARSRRRKKKRRASGAVATAGDALALEQFVAQMIDTTDPISFDPESSARDLLYGPAHTGHKVWIARDERLEHLAASMDQTKLDAAPPEVRDYLRRKYGK